MPKKSRSKQPATSIQPQASARLKDASSSASCIAWWTSGRGRRPGGRGAQPAPAAAAAAGGR
eukprot:8307797-Pyramimonas_sp.AAC.1